MTALRWFWLACAMAFTSAYLSNCATRISPDDPTIDVVWVKVISGLMLMFGVASCVMSVLESERDRDG